MKKLHLGALAFAGMLALAACKNEGNAATDETTESLATAPSSATDGSTASATPVSEGQPAVEVPTGPLTTLSFGETTFDFGDVDEGEMVTHIYKFTNTGKEPLVIKDAKGSCGCTVPKWPKTPIPPGEQGEIQVEFNSKGKTGKQTKRVTINANTDPAQTFLTISGNVIGKAPAAGDAEKPAQ
ncbi:MAG TPA: DUF1573 domain-containing protein [Saprospiraceae bacterium]|nr:DUF1573 domain-containing protein [Saprospiraceae bacterium]